ncbi:MAG: hypothetical protein K0Q52_2404 [Microbacterium sp.]|nr:hypothetical protein [Microbacterium sp.]
MLVTPTRRCPDDGGSALISVLIVSLVLGLLAVTLSAAVVNTTRSTVGVRGTLQSQGAADAGLAAAVAAARSGDVCATTVPAGTLSTGTYAATVACNPARTEATLTSTGTAGGSSTRVQAVYTLVAETTEVKDPSLTPVGLVLYEGSTMGQVTLLANGNNEPQVVSVKGPFGCRLGIPGNLIVGGDVTSSDGCNVTGDIYAAGNITFAGGETTVLGDIIAAGTGTTKLNSAIGSATAGSPRSVVRTGGPVDFAFGSARIHADVFANGGVRVPRVIDGSVTLPRSITPDVTSSGRIDGGVINTDVTPPAPPALPGWYDYKYAATDWPGAVVVTLRKVTANATDTCEYYNQHTGWDVKGTYVGGSNRGWKDLANYTGTVVIDARACDLLTSNAGGNPAPMLKASNVVFLAKKFDTTGLTMTSATGASPKVYFITEDTTADAKPSCPAGVDATNFNTNGANLVGVKSLIYTPCRLSVSGGGVLLGSLYTNGFDSGGQITIKGELMSLPGMTPPDGGYGGTPVVVNTGEYTLGAVVSRRDVAAP